MLGDTPLREKVKTRHTFADTGMDVQRHETARRRH
jgi:hypothetical protein